MPLLGPNLRDAKAREEVLSLGTRELNATGGIQMKKMPE